MAVKEELLKRVFISLVLLYAVFLLVEPALGLSDEYAFLPMLQIGKYFPMYGEDFPYYNTAELGSFGPLGGQEYNLVAFFTNSPLGYFGFNAVELLLCAIFLTMNRFLRRLPFLPRVICCCGKILGADGSGFMLFYVRPERQASVKEQLRRLIHVPFRFENSGSRIVLYQPNGLT